MSEKIKKTDDEWRQQLSADQFEITRKAGTERAFTGEYWDCKEEGIYLCRCCGSELFSSDTKYDSGSGWPSFTEPAEEASVAEHVDSSLGMARTEVICARCDAHLGHVFPDGPAPSGQRYCINSASIDLKRGS